MEDLEGILTRHKRMRSASRETGNALLDLCRPSVKQAARDLGVWVKTSAGLLMYRRRGYRLPEVSPLRCGVFSMYLPSFMSISPV